MRGTPGIPSDARGAESSSNSVPGVVGADPARLKVVAEQFATVAQRAAGIETRIGRVLVLADANGSAAEAYAKVPEVMSELSEVAAAAHSGAGLLLDRAFRQSRKSEPSKTGAAGPRLRPSGAEYRIGPPTAPSIPHHNHFPYDPSQKPMVDDYLNRKKWMARLWGAKALRSDLKDATDAYHHYWFGEGAPLQVDYEKAYRDDPVVRKWVDKELESARWAAEGLYLRSGQTSFQMTGDRVDVGESPATENWQKTIGRHHMWVTADVKVDGDKVTAMATVHVRDWYNFNRGGTDNATGLPDNENGRFATIGWAKEFETHGSLRREMTWTMSAPERSVTSDGAATTPKPSGSGRR